MLRALALRQSREQYSLIFRQLEVVRGGSERTTSSRLKIRLREIWIAYSLEFFESTASDVLGAKLFARVLRTRNRNKSCRAGIEHHIVARLCTSFFLSTYKSLVFLFKSLDLSFQSLHLVETVLQLLETVLQCLTSAFQFLRHLSSNFN